MAGKRGLNADIRVDNSGGTLTEISTYTKEVNFSRDAELIDATTFQPAGAGNTPSAGWRCWRCARRNARCCSAAQCMPSSSAR